MDRDTDEVNRELLEVCYEDSEEYLQEVGFFDIDKYESLSEGQHLVLGNTLRLSSDTLDRLPPHNLDAEKAILGIYLNHPDRRGKHDKNLSDKFYFHVHEILHRAVIKLPHLDMILLEDTLKREDNFDAVNGTAGLVELLEFGRDLNPEHILDYIKIVKDFALRRAVIHYSTVVMRSAYYLDDDIIPAIKHLRSELKKLKKE